MSHMKPVIFLDIDGVNCTRKAAGWSIKGRRLVKRLVTMLVRRPARAIDVDTKLDTLATKADLHEALNSQMWKLVTALCGFGAALIAAVYFVAKHT